MATWIDLLLQVLCQMYKEWGGDCADLYNKPSEAPKTVVAEYNDNGPPKLSDQKAIDDFLLLLDQLESCLADPDNSLSEDDTKSLTGMIFSLRAYFEP